MTQRTITLRQMLAILFLCLFTLGTQRLFGRLDPVGGAAWVCPLAAGALVLAVTLLLGRKRTLGDPLGGDSAVAPRVWAGVLLLWGFFLTAAQAARIGSRLADSLRASPALVGFAVLLLAGWLAVGGLPAFARTTQIFLLAVGGGFLLVFLSGVFRLDWEYLVLWQTGDLAQAPAGTLALLGTLAVGSWALLFVREIEPGERGRSALVVRLGLLFLALTAAVALVLGRFGPALTRQIDRPFFQMVSGLGLEGAFQRLEALVSALWLLGDAALLAFLLLSLGRLLARALGREESKGQLWSLTALAFLASLPTGFWNGVLAGVVLPLGNLAAGVLLLGLGLKHGNLKKLEKT